MFEKFVDRLAKYEDLQVWAPRNVTVLLMLLGAACLLVYALFGMSYEHITTPDGKRDIAFALNLIKVGFNPVDYLGTVDMLQPGIQYLIYIYLLAICHLIGGDNWLVVLIVFNVAAYAAAAYLLLSLTVSITRSLVGVVVVFTCLALGFEYYQWISQSQSEALFILVVVASFYFVNKVWMSPDAASARMNMALAVCVAALSFIVRPTSPPVIGFVVVALILNSISRSVSPHELRRRLLAFSALGVAVMTGIIFAAVTLTHDPSVLPASKVRDVLLLYREFFLEGAVVLHRPETFIPVSDSVLGFAAVSFMRIPYYFWFVAEDFSFSHTLLNTVYSVPLYALALVGLTVGLWGRHATDQITPIIAAFLSLSLIVLFDVYHAATILDFNWRYRAPAYPAMYLLSGQAAAWLAARIVQRLALGRR